MSDAKSLFALADGDDAAALLLQLGDTPTYRVRSESGETLFLYSLYRGKTKCVDALQRRGGLTLQEAAAAGDVQRIDALVGAAPWTIQSLSADGWTALTPGGVRRARCSGDPLARARARMRGSGRARSRRISPSTPHAPVAAWAGTHSKSWSPPPAIRTSPRNTVTRR